MRRPSCTPLLVLLALSAVACGGGGTTPEDGPLKIGIVAGNNQMTVAGTPRLADPVVGQLVRLPNGQVAWRTIVVDAVLPPKAYAQTLNGSPVVGAVVCAASVSPAISLTPVVPCTNTDAVGKATFAFTPGVQAGNAKAVVQGMLNGIVATFDTARATIQAGPPAPFITSTGVRMRMKFEGDTAVHVGDTLDLQAMIGDGTRDAQNILRGPTDQYGNAVHGYTIEYREVYGPTLAEHGPFIVSGKYVIPATFGATPVGTGRHGIGLRLGGIVFTGFSFHVVP